MVMLSGSLCGRLEPIATKVTAVADMVTMVINSHSGDGYVHNNHDHNVYYVLGCWSFGK